MEFEAVMIPSSSMPLRFTDKCIACGRCVEACQVDVLMLSEGEKHPVVMYPGECWYCGACVMECPVEGAVLFRHPLMNQTKFVPVRRKQ